VSLVLFAWGGLFLAGPARGAEPSTSEAQSAEATRAEGQGGSPAAPGAEDVDEEAAEVMPVPAGVSDDKEPAPGTGADACIDENVRADLLAKRQRRNTRDRLFQKTNRHELGVFGGYYASYLFDRSFIVGGSYAYHMTEDLAIEATGGYTRLSSTAAAGLERSFSLLEGKSRNAFTAEADLVWVPAYAKLRAGGSIVHFDLYLEGGGGIVDSALSSDIAANGGLGVKMFWGRASAVRLDVRDRFYRQQLLARGLWVNDVTTTLGLSVFLPWSE
jgi:outer membrane beta-barrel protein